MVRMYLLKYNYWNWKYLLGSKTGYNLDRSDFYLTYYYNHPDKLFYAHEGAELINSKRFLEAIKKYV